MTRRWLPSAKKEFIRALRYLKRKRPGHEVLLAREVEETRAYLETQPFSGHRLASGRREYVLPTFSYSLVYEIDADGVVVVALAHKRRGPKYRRGTERRVKEPRLAYAA